MTAKSTTRKILSWGCVVFVLWAVIVAALYFIAPGAAISVIIIYLLWAAASMLAAFLDD